MSSTTAPEGQRQLEVDAHQILTDLELLEHSFPEVQTFNEAVQAHALVDQEFSVLQKPRAIWDKMRDTVKQYSGQLLRMEQDIAKKDEDANKTLGEDRITRPPAKKDVPLLSWKTPCSLFSALWATSMN